AVVTIPNPFPSCSRWNRPRQRINDSQGRLPAPATPAAAERPPFHPPIRRNKQSRIVLLAPLPDERKPAIGTHACNALIQRRAMIFSDISGGPEAAVTKCRLRFFSPTSPKTPVPSSGSAPALAWPP